MAFVKEEFLPKNIQKKEDIFVDLTTNKGGCTCVNSMEAYEGYKVTKKLDKVWS